MNRLRELERLLCPCAVFCRVMRQPLLLHFADVCRSDSSCEQRLRAYGAMVNEIYEQGGGSLTELVCRLLSEDENAYVRAWGAKAEIPTCMAQAVERELAYFTEFAALTTADFERALGVSALPSFHSERVSLSALYEERMQNIGRYGYGIFSAHPMFRLGQGQRLEPIVSADRIDVSHFVGYEEERQRVLCNTEAFLAGAPAANVLLCGDAGTGKSSTVKAVVNRFFNRGLRLVELRKDQLSYLPEVMAQISGNPLKFIIFIDDLSFRCNDDSFGMLKAALEGSASVKAENAVIYATSNRRHIVRESFEEREGTDVHRNDALQESLSLSQRFGLVVLFEKPDKALYLEIVRQLAARHRLSMDAEELNLRAEAFALRKGVRSARCAEQFVAQLVSAASVQPRNEDTEHVEIG